MLAFLHKIKTTLQHGFLLGFILLIPQVSAHDTYHSPKTRDYHNEAQEETEGPIIISTNSTEDVSAILDGDTSTFWADGGNFFITIDLQEQIEVDAVRMSFPGVRKYDFNVMISERKDYGWTYLLSGATSAGGMRTELFEDFPLLEAREGRFIHITISGNDFNDVSRINEVEFGGVHTGARDARQAGVAARNVNRGNIAGRSFHQFHMDMIYGGDTERSTTIGDTANDGDGDEGENDFVMAADGSISAEGYELTNPNRTSFSPDYQEVLNDLNANVFPYQQKRESKYVGMPEGGGGYGPGFSGEITGGDVYLGDGTTIAEVNPTGISPTVGVSNAMWRLTLPVDQNGDGVADEIDEWVVAAGYNDEYFFGTTDGTGTVFVCPVEGARTSTKTKFRRCELREMLRAGNRDINAKGLTPNNWVLSNSPALSQVRNYDGYLIAEVAVNHVTTSGDPNQVGRVIIGQIHGHDDEPIRLYYHKMPHHTNGSIYFASEPYGSGSDAWYELLGQKDRRGPDPIDGIPLDERFTYEILVIDTSMTVTVTKADGYAMSRTIDIGQFAQPKEYLYFKAGVYNQNNTGLANDYVQATFFRIENQHNRI